MEIQPLSADLLDRRREYSRRHIGPSETEVQAMLKTLGFSNLEELALKVIPANIRTKDTMAGVGQGMSEDQVMLRLKKIMSANLVFENFLGQGYSGTITPSPIRRKVFENPNWYTSYTPYQPEISQGRLEAMLNFQTMVCDLTGMEISNASLLDEGTATAEAIAMALNISKKKTNKFLASPNLHPHVLDVLKTRAWGAGWEMIIGEPETSTDDIFAAVVGYPDTRGEFRDLTSARAALTQQNALMIVNTDPLALTLVKPPGEFGADVVVGNSQRFGVPLGNGGPHAAFMATRDAFKRNLPGRLVGVSVDVHGNKALRLTLQTREQHIRREKATSNICTAQVLLANMAAFYAVYHGPEGLKKMGQRTHLLTQILASSLKAQGHKIENGKNFFDTLTVSSPLAASIVDRGHQLRINLRLMDKTRIGISLDETTDLESLTKILKAFGIEVSIASLEKTATQIHSYGFEKNLERSSSYLTHPTFNSYHSESELVRYIERLESKDLTLTHSMIPLGSCTMKLNAATTLYPVSWPEINAIHPMAPAEQTLGYKTLCEEMQTQLSSITGFPGILLPPNAGSQGEYAGLLAIRKYHESRNENHRNVCLIPSSAHGTNPASAVMTGLDIQLVLCDSQGNIDVADLKMKSEKFKDRLSSLMVTYPSTHGVFEASIREICDIVHKNGGQVYMDGANLNAMVGLCRPGEIGIDVSHMNLHKTFAIPHGGGGPGIGPIGVAAHLIPHLPEHVTSAPLGSASILPISWSYISMLGADELRRCSLIAILNANYMAKKLQNYFPILYKGQEGLVAHECILDLRDFKVRAGIEVNDVAKRLMDYGFHAPTMSWPVAGTLMVEPTESESKVELDRFIEAMSQIHAEILKVEKGLWPKENNPLVNSPHSLVRICSEDWKNPYSRELGAFPTGHQKRSKFWPSVGRIDNAFGDKNVFCSCPPLEEFQEPSA